ncbi:hypothetical protein P692DRAFT_20880686 [Suillus brevipes Sb2]|nr:hypothetical protein P692DRAFT_20880686 [Suillus brevipes Sb2]
MGSTITSVGPRNDGRPKNWFVKRLVAAIIAASGYQKGKANDSPASELSKLAIDFLVVVLPLALIVKKAYRAAHPPHVVFFCHKLLELPTLHIRGSPDALSVCQKSLLIPCLQGREAPDSGILVGERDGDRLAVTGALNVYKDFVKGFSMLLSSSKDPLFTSILKATGVAEVIDKVYDAFSDEVLTTSSRNHATEDDFLIRHSK